MGNKKKELRDKLRADKKNTTALKKELLSLPKDNPRAIEIRRLLGIATLSDLLGSLVPLRVCTHCGKRAYNYSELLSFRRHSESKHGYANCCIDCHNLKQATPGILIVGPHCPLPMNKYCSLCGRVEVGTGSRSWFISRSTICKCCLGTHEDVLGYPIPLKQVVAIPVVFNGVTYESILALSTELQRPYHEVRLKVIQNKLKDYNA